MEISEVLKKVRRIEIKAKGMINEMFSGDYHSAFKGRGMLFSEVKEYHFGDDIRNIDWNVTARFDEPYVKVFEEERELTVMLIIDVSGSTKAGGKENVKRELIAELAAIISFSATQNNDKVGAILFDQDVELFIPPRKGKSHALRIIRDIIEFDKPIGKEKIVYTYEGTAKAIKYLNSSIKKKSTAVLITDFFDQNYESQLKMACKKHDMIALRMREKYEFELPKASLVPIHDLETNEVMLMDTSKSVRKKVIVESKKWEDNLAQYFKKIGLDYAVIPTEGGYIRELKTLFKQRLVKR